MEERAVCIGDRVPEEVPRFILDERREVREPAVQAPSFRRELRDGDRCFIPLDGVGLRGLDGVEGRATIGEEVAGREDDLIGPGSVLMLSSINNLC